MMCSVCDGIYFSNPNDDCNSGLEVYLNGEVQCNHCGWEDTEYENISSERPSEYRISFNEWLIWFKVQR